MLKEMREIFTDENIANINFEVDIKRKELKDELAKMSI